MKKNLIVKQDGYKECGVACLLSIIRYFGGNISINKLIELTNTDKTGTSFFNIKKVALDFGLRAEGFKATDKTKNKLKKIKLPSICQVIDNNYEHFIVIYKINENTIIIMDPAKGKVIYDINTFLNIWTGYFMTFTKIKKLPYIKDEKYLNKVIINLIKKNRGTVLNIIILSSILTIISSTTSMYSGFVIDYVIKTSKNKLLIITLIFSILILIRCIISFFRNRILIYFNQKFDYTVFTTSFTKILLLPHSYYKNRTTGEVITKVNDLQYIKNMLSKIILTLFVDLVISITCAIILLKINTLMFILLMVTILIYLIIFLIFTPIQKKYTEMNQQNNAEINSLMIETINGYETIKNLNLENIMIKKMFSLYSNSLNKVVSYDKINNLELLFKDVVTFFSLLIIEFIGFNFVLDGVITIGQIIVFTSLVSFFITPIRNIIDLNKEYFYAINSVRRANNLLDVQSIDLKNNTNYNIKGNIKIKNLSFSYNDYVKVLNNINIDISAGEKVLILGNSGSGKSTILKLLGKYFNIEKNKIYLDNIDINNISLSNLRKYLTFVSQEETLFNDSIKNNIKMNREITQSEFIKVCKMLFIDEFLDNMILGYNMKLEENGSNISGGQRQRIILARALLKIGNIMLIDEGLNAIDTNLERKILKNIFSEYKSKTIIIVSHRIENMDLYDKVIEFSNGTIKSITKRSNSY